MAIATKTHELPYLSVWPARPVQDYLAAGRPVITPAQERHQAYQLRDSLYAGRPAADYASAYLIVRDVVEVRPGLALPAVAMDTPENVAANALSSGSDIIIRK